jgi:uncharacterized protein (TIGR02246 family)
MSDPYALHFLNDWADCLNHSRLDELLAMYEDEAVLLPTFGSEILRGQEALRGYFTALMEHPNLTVHIEDEQINQNAHDEHRVLSGDYEFSWGTDASDMIHVHARYTFALSLADDKWVASTHHSSVRPV